MKAVGGCAGGGHEERESDTAVGELKPPRLGTPVEVNASTQGEGEEGI